MSGFFGVAAHDSCTADLFYGTDYHCHLGTRRGGLAVLDGGRFTRFIHDITNAQFKSKFEHDIGQMQGACGIGVISDYEDQPLIIGSHLGTYAIVTVGRIGNVTQLAEQACRDRGVHFSEMAGNVVNPTELIATLINREDSFVAGINAAQEAIDGSCSLLILTQEGIYAARDRYGRTPVIIGQGEAGHAVTMESCALPNLGYRQVHELGPGEIVLIQAEGFTTLNPPGDCLQVCAFLWVYYGYPASSYHDINVEVARYRSGGVLARRDDAEIDCVAGIPDSGTAHALGYAEAAGVRYCRPFVKYTPTWPRSFMPQQQDLRDLVARMKLIPIPELIAGQRVAFCDDSIVRGTQMKDCLRRVYEFGAAAVHMRPACPPLVFGCNFLNFSRSRSVMELAARRAIAEIAGQQDVDLRPYTDPDDDHYAAMVERIGQRLEVSSLRYQRLDDLVGSIGLPKHQLCTYCWDGCDGRVGCRHARAGE